MVLTPFPDRVITNSVLLDIPKLPHLGAESALQAFLSEAAQALPLKIGAMIIEDVTSGGAWRYYCKYY